MRNIQIALTYSVLLRSGPSHSLSSPLIHLSSNSLSLSLSQRSNQSGWRAQGLRRHQCCVLSVTSEAPQLGSLFSPRWSATARVDEQHQISAPLPSLWVSLPSGADGLRCGDCVGLDPAVRAVVGNRETGSDGYLHLSPSSTSLPASSPRRRRLHGLLRC